MTFQVSFLPLALLHVPVSFQIACSLPLPFPFDPQRCYSYRLAWTKSSWFYCWIGFFFKEVSLGEMEWVRKGNTFRNHCAMRCIAKLWVGIISRFNGGRYRPLRRCQSCSQNGSSRSHFPEQEFLHLSHFLFKNHSQKLLQFWTSLSAATVHRIIVTGCLDYFLKWYWFTQLVR